jgi:hypothetical protein
MVCIACVRAKLEVNSEDLKQNTIEINPDDVDAWNEKGYALFL